MSIFIVYKINSCKTLDLMVIDCPVSSDSVLSPQSGDNNLFTLTDNKDSFWYCTGSGTFRFAIRVGNCIRISLTCAL